MTLQSGKLPAALLAELLGRLTSRDPRVLIGPGIGRDAAVIDIGNGRVLVAKTDPITFATDHIGWYAVHVNANDIACMGARPAWMLATALLPAGCDEGLPAQIFDQLTGACSALDIELVGGHTEVTPAVDRPVIVGAMLGEAARDDIVVGDGIVDGDVVLLTKGIAIEGTAVLAREAVDGLRTSGVDSAALDRAAALLFDPGISVVRDAQVICAAVRPRLMHDPTEGGIATALAEIAHAAGQELRIDPGSVRVFDETRAVCDALALDPAGLLASGALLAIVDAGDAARAIAACTDAGIACVAIGYVVSGPRGVIMAADGSGSPYPSFPRDELARYFDEAAQHPT